MAWPRSAYVLKKVTSVLDSMDIEYERTSPPIFGPSLFYTGCEATIAKGMILSIQTHPMIAGEAFCECCIIENSVSPRAYELYEDDSVKKMYSLKDLQIHLAQLQGIANECRAGE